MMYCVGKYNALNSGHKANFFSNSICSFTLVANCKQDARFVIFLFCTDFLLFTLSSRLEWWNNYSVVVHPQFSPIKAIKLPERFPSSPATELGRTPVSL